MAPLQSAQEVMDVLQHGHPCLGKMKARQESMASKVLTITKRHMTAIKLYEAIKEWREAIQQEVDTGVLNYANGVWELPEDPNEHERITGELEAWALGVERLEMTQALVTLAQQALAHTSGALATFKRPTQGSNKHALPASDMNNGQRAPKQPANILKASAATVVALAKTKTVEVALVKPPTTPAVQEQQTEMSEANGDDEGEGYANADTLVEVEPEVQGNQGKATKKRTHSAPAVQDVRTLAESRAQLCFSFSKALPHGWKLDHGSTEGHIECMKVGIQAVNAAAQRASTAVSCMGELAAEDHCHAEARQAAGLPPMMPLVSHALWVQVRNMVVGLLLPKPEKSFLYGVLDGYTVDQEMTVFGRTDKVDKDLAELAWDLYNTQLLDGQADTTEEVPDEE
ncbi:hypothetical protein C8T65DRAFT_738223 [Cerioporus squamosus]|nr:hypothetical protein C8T65DRAFT_738223 [Cerioporus squamosus]